MYHGEGNKPLRGAGEESFRRGNEAHGKKHRQGRTIVTGWRRRNAWTIAGKRVVWALPMCSHELPSRLMRRQEILVKMASLAGLRCGASAWPLCWVPRLRKCYLPIFRFGHKRILGVTLRHLERRALMLFRSAKS